MEDKHYYDSMYLDYDKITASLWGGSLKPCQDRIRFLLGLVPFSLEDLVMDVAAGTGIASEIILERKPKQLFLVDHSAGMLQEAEFRLGKYEQHWKFIGDKWEQNERTPNRFIRSSYVPLAPIPGVEFILTDAYRLDDPNLEHVGDCLVDKVVIANAFSSFNDPSRLLQAVYHRLRDGGCILLNSKLKGSFKPLHTHVEDFSYSLFDVYDTTDKAPVFTSEAIIGLLEQEGFVLRHFSEEDVYLSEEEVRAYVKGTVDRILPSMPEEKKRHYWRYIEFKADQQQTYLRTEGYFVAQKI
ncbi:class I SAM-dependent methyltransferase [Candidatus Woesearchaeota archaeon]|nr:class I SAM-dependent methyltransferase [Candidatus Woesearchaeota archaeon]